MKTINTIRDVLFEYELNGNDLTIIINGRVDATNTTQIQAMFEWIVTDKVLQNIVVDGKNLTYISSAGLRWLLSLKKSTKAYSMSIINLEPSVENVFYVTGFDNVFNIGG